MTRRDILKMALLLGAQSIPSIFNEAAEASFISRNCSGKLSIRSNCNGEFLNVRYLDKKGRFDKDAIKKLNHLFRCHYDGVEHSIHPGLFIALDAIRCQIGAKERPYILYSGYRSPKYNRILCSESSEVAHRSYHLKGMAADIEVEGVSLRDISRTAKKLKTGGVGYYSDFVHIDVGPVRYW